MIYHIVYIPVIYRLNMDGQKTTTKNGTRTIQCDECECDCGGFADEGILWGEIELTYETLILCKSCYETVASSQPNRLVA